MSELSVFVDESGNMGPDSIYYALTLVLHDQEDDIADNIASYEQSLRTRGLKDMPMHLTPLLHGNGDYRDVDVAERNRQLLSFKVFTDYLPFWYKALIYRKSEYQSRGKLGEKLQRDIKAFLLENIGTFQSHSLIKIYYDDGQRIVSSALHGAFENVLGKPALIYRDASPREYRLSQVADYVCGIEFVATKYSHHEEGPSDRAFFGTERDLKKTYLKKLRKKRL